MSHFLDAAGDAMPATIVRRAALILGHPVARLESQPQAAWVRTSFTRPEAVTLLMAACRAHQHGAADDAQALLEDACRAQLRAEAPVVG